MNGAREEAKPPVRTITHCLIADRFADASTRSAASGDISGDVLSRPSITDSSLSSPSRPSDLSSANSEGNFYWAAARVGLQVAETLSYAHGQGIVHRDIKPSNLLLDVKGTVWVTDFGLAKSEGSDGPTQTGDIVGTLRYMAPERFDGWSDPRTDVYALGATLYELITLRPLYEESNRARLIERVLNDAPMPPRKHDRRIPRDLETIILKALSREPSARYATAEAMAEDLRRFLADKPIFARRSGAAEKTWRWCRRNPAVASLLGTLAGVFLVAFVAVTFAWRNADASRVLADERRIDSEKNEREAKRQKARAEAGVAKARSAVDEYLNKVTDSQRLQVPGMQSLRRDLLKAGLGFYQDFLREHDDDPGLRLLEADVQFRAAKLIAQINPGPPTEVALQRALRLYEALDRDRPGDDEVRAGLADVLSESNKDLRAIALLDPLVQRRPGDMRYQRLLHNALNGAAIERSHASDPEEAVRLYLRAFEVAQTLVRLEPDVAENHMKLAATLNNIGLMLGAWPVLRSHQFIDLFRFAAAHGERVHALDPENTLASRDVLIMNMDISDMKIAAGLVEVGMREFEENTEFGRQRAARNPELASCQMDLIQALGRKAAYELRFGRKEQCTRTLREQLDLLGKYEPRQQRGGEAAFLQAGALALLAKIQDGLDPRPAAPPSDRAAMSVQAMAALDRAIAQGYRDVGKLKSLRNLNSLIERPDYQSLVARLDDLLRKEGLAPPEPPNLGLKQA